MRARTELEKVLNIEAEPKQALNIETILGDLCEPIDGLVVELSGDDLSRFIDWLESTAFWGRCIGRSLKCLGEDCGGNEFLSTWMTAAQFGRFVADGKGHPALKALVGLPEEWKDKGTEVVYFDGYRKPR